MLTLFALVIGVTVLYGQCPGPWSVTVTSPSVYITSIILKAPDSLTVVRNVNPLLWQIPFSDTYAGLTVVLSPAVSSSTIYLPPAGSGTTQVSSWNLLAYSIPLPVVGNPVTSVFAISPSIVSVPVLSSGSGSTAVASWTTDTVSLPLPGAFSASTSISTITPDTTAIVFVYPSQSTMVQTTTITLTAISDTGTEQICPVFSVFWLSGDVRRLADEYLIVWEARNDFLATHYDVLALHEGRITTLVVTQPAQARELAQYEYRYKIGSDDVLAFIIKAYNGRKLLGDLVLYVPSQLDELKFHVITPWIESNCIGIRYDGLKNPADIMIALYSGEGSLLARVSRHITPSAGIIYLPLSNPLQSGIYFLELRMYREKWILPLYLLY